MCCVCGWTCKLISFLLSAIIIVGIILIILWQTGVIFQTDNTDAAKNSLSTLLSGTTRN